MSIEILKILIGGGVAGALTSLITVLIFAKAKNKNITANSYHLSAQADALVFDSYKALMAQQEEVLKRHTAKILQLEEEVKLLKQRENLHEDERTKLRKEIILLKEENERLFKLDNLNTQEITKLRKEIEKYEKEIK